MGFIDGCYSSIDEITEDHGKVAVEKLRAFLRDFFTPLGESCSEADFERFCSEVQNQFVRKAIK